MEADFFELYESQPRLNVQLGHNSVADWCIEIWDRTNGKIGERGEPIISLQDCDRKKVFAEAYSKLADYLSETRGGY